MKKVVMIMVLGVLMACLVPAQAQNTQEWQTSTMVGSGSAYSPQVTEVGATTVTSNVTTTTESYSPASGPNRAKKFDTGGDSGQGPSPVGDAALPLLLMSLAFAGVIYFRKRRAHA